METLRDKVEQVRQLPPEQRSADTELWLRSCELSDEVRRLLGPAGTLATGAASKGVYARLGAEAQAAMKGTLESEALAKFVQASALLVEAAGLLVWDQATLRGLARHCLPPVIDMASGDLFGAGVVDATAPNVLKLMAAWVFLMVGEASAQDASSAACGQQADEMLAAAIEAFCPTQPAYQRELKRRLASRAMVPLAGGSGPGAAAAAAVLEGGAEMDGWLGLLRRPGSPTSLPADLTAASLHRSLRLLSVWAGTERFNRAASKAGWVQGAMPAAMLPQLHALLADCQLMLDLDPRCSFAYRTACNAASFLLGPATVAAVMPHFRRLVEQGLDVARSTNCALPLCELLLSRAKLPIQLLGARALPPPAEVQAAQAAEREAAQLERQLERWLPRIRVHAVNVLRWELKEAFKKLATEPAPGSREPIRLSTGMDPKRCSHCGRIQAQLRTCSACHEAFYCDRDCQKAAWKDHKKQCSKAAK